MPKLSSDSDVAAQERYNQGYFLRVSQRHQTKVPFHSLPKKSAESIVSSHHQCQKNCYNIQRKRKYCKSSGIAPLRPLHVKSLKCTRTRQKSQLLFSDWESHPPLGSRHGIRRACKRAVARSFGLLCRYYAKFGTVG